MKVTRRHRTVSIRFSTTASDQQAAASLLSALRGARKDVDACGAPTSAGLPCPWSRDACPLHSGTNDERKP